MRDEHIAIVLAAVYLVGAFTAFRIRYTQAVMRNLKDPDRKLYMNDLGLEESDDLLYLAFSAITWPIRLIGDGGTWVLHHTLLRPPKSLREIRKEEQNRAERILDQETGR